MRAGSFRGAVFGYPSGATMDGVSDCMTCELIAARDDGRAPPWDRIRRTAHWDVVHAFDTSIEGWIVVVARNHVASVAELEYEAAVELGPLLRNLSRALVATVGCTKTYVVQFAEDPAPDHIGRAPEELPYER